MSKSFEFCVNRASDPDVSSYTDRDWINAIELVNTKERFDTVLNGCRKFRISGTDASGEKINLDVEICFDANADFGYFTSVYCVHDGTLYFVMECVNRCMNNVLGAATCDARLRREIVNGCTIRYTVGNFVMSNEYGDFGSAEKPWLKSRTTVLLPLKQEVVV